MKWDNGAVANNEAEQDYGERKNGMKLSWREIDYNVYKLNDNHTRVEIDVIFVVSYFQPKRK